MRRLQSMVGTVLALALQASMALAQTAASDAGGDSLTLSQVMWKLFSWVQDQQQWFSQNMTGAIDRLAGGDAWSAGLLLAAFSFVYGVFHAVGPGHGKAVISSYVLANERTLRRGVLIAFMAGFFQAVSAIVLVSIMALVFNLGSRRMTTFSNNLETVSYAVITLFGVWLLFGQVRGMFQTQLTDDHGHDHAHDRDHDHGEDDHDHHGHVHLPGPETLAGAWSWTKAIGLAAAVGLRPCTGALIVLVVALHQHHYWAGIVSTFVMALGTSITVSLLAIMAVGSRDLATRLAGASELWVGRIETLAKVGGGSVMVVVGMLFFFASLYPHPFQ